MRQRRIAGAFSMIEILVVVMIIGVLATMMLPALSRSRERARHVQCQNNLKNLHVAAMSHLYEWGVMPASRSYEEWTDQFDRVWLYEFGWVCGRNWARHFSNSGTSNYRAPGRPDLWWGPVGMFCITNQHTGHNWADRQLHCQSLWNYTGKNLKNYICPKFNTEDIRGTKDPEGKNFGGTNQPLRSYVMNARAHMVPLGIANASRLLLFADAHTSNTNWAMNRAGTAKVRICRQGLLENKPNVTLAPNGVYQLPATAILQGLYKFCTPVAYDGTLDGFHDPTATPANAWPIESVGVYHGTKKIGTAEHPYGYGVFCDGHVETLFWWQTTNACYADW